MANWLPGNLVNRAIAALPDALTTIFVPLPRFGLTPEFVASMHLSGSGLWIDKQQTAIVFGAFYFGALARFGFYLVDKVATAPASTRKAA